MTVEELKVEAERLGYSICKSQKGVCTCIGGRKYNLDRGRKKCLRYDFEKVTPRGYTHCRRLQAIQ